MKHFFASAAFIGIMAATTAWAIPKVTFTAGNTSVTVTDNQLGDLNPAAGAILFFGWVGGWQISAAQMQSPAMGVGTPLIQLTSAESTIQGVGELSITFTDFIPGPWSGPGAIVSVGGSSGSETSGLDFMTMINGITYSNIAAAGSHFDGHAAFSYPDYAADADFAMVATIDHVGSTWSGFSYSLTPVPEPGTLVLLGSAFMATAIFCKRRTCRQA